MRQALVRDLVKVLAIHSMFGLSVACYLVWMLAFLHGGRITVTISMFGEMWAEFVLWLVISPIITLGVFFFLRDHSPPEGT